MPMFNLRDKIGPFYRYGETGYKYRYIPNNPKSRALAREKCIRQIRAIQASKKFNQTYHF